MESVVEIKLFKLDILLGMAYRGYQQQHKQQRKFSHGLNLRLKKALKNQYLPNILSDCSQQWESIC
jgi:hypothetical protein